MSHVLVIANETIGGAKLLDAVRTRAATPGTRFTLVVPRSRPRHGGVIYAEAVHDMAQVRVDLALSFMRDEGVEVDGEVGDEDAYNAALDAIAEHKPDEVLVSTYPEARSGWLRRDLVERIRAATDVPVEHIVIDLDAEGIPFTVTLVVANRTAGGSELIERLREMAGNREGADRRLFIVVIPQDDGGGGAPTIARARLSDLLERLHGEGLLAAGMIADPDPYVATMNALQFFRVDEVVISTLAETRSGWLRAHLVERVSERANVPVHHVVVELARETAGSTG